MLRRCTALFLIFALLFSTAPTAFADDNTPPTGEVKPGLYINDIVVNTGAWSGAIIVTATSANTWPFAAPAASGEAAFTPVADQKYRLTAKITSTGAEGIRIRWTKDATGGNSSYTTADAAAVNDHVASAGVTATVIPAYFQNTLSTGDTKEFVTEFVMDGSAVADGLIGNITIRGQSGSNAFSVDAIKIEKVDVQADEVLFSWDKTDPPDESEQEGYAKADPYIGTDPGAGVSNILLATVNMESWEERATPLDNRIENSGDSTFEMIPNPFGEGTALKINYDFNGATTFGGISLEGAFNESITIPEGALIEYDLYYPKSVGGKLMRFRIKAGDADNVDPYLRDLDTTNLNPDWQDYYMGETWLRNLTSVSAKSGSGSSFVFELHGETSRPAETTTVIVANIRILQPDPNGTAIPLIINTQNYADVTPLKDKYNAQSNFMVGAIGTGNVTGVRAKHYTIFVAGNSLKAEPTHPNGPSWLKDVDGNALEGATTEPGLGEYNMPTAEYQAVRDSGSPGEYKLHAHVLAWYNQAPAWMRQIVPANLQSGYNGSVNFYGLGNSVTTQVKVDADMAKRVQYNHTMYVMRHFLTTDAKYGSSEGRGIIPFNSWDVLNEEVHETRYKSMIEEDPNSWRESLKHTNWLVAMSDDAIGGDITDHYIYLLFKYAHIAAPNAKMAEAYAANYANLPDYMKLDGHDSNGRIDEYVTEAPPKLTYNDYDTNNRDKARTVYNMVKALNTAWLSDPLYDGRPLIEDLGIQGHDSVGSTLASDNQYAVALYASLVDAGLLKGIAFSEFDLKYPVTAPGGGALAPARLNVKQSDTLGYQYALMYKMFTKFAPYIDHIISWGVQGEGWGSSYVLFDELGNANAGYYGAMDPDRYINGHSYLDYYFEGENAALAEDYDIDLGDLGVYNVANGGLDNGTDEPGGGSGGSSGSSSSGGGGGGRSTPTVVTSSNVSANGSVNSQAALSEANKALTAAGDTAVITTKNAQSISAATLKSLASAAQKAGKSIVLNADTLSADNRGIQARLYVEPAKLANLSADLKLRVYTEPSKTSATKSSFEKWFENKLAVIKCEQKGSFGAELKIAAKLNLSGFDTSNLVFYSYDKESNSYVIIATPKYFIDKNGYLHFYTERAGDIIVSENRLAKK